MDPILSDDEMDELREVGESMMTTPVMVLRVLEIGVGDTGYDPNYAYGDELSGYDYGDDAVLPMPGFVGTPSSENVIAGEDGNLKGWFVSKLQGEVGQDTGEIATIDFHVVRLPVGTDVKPDDTLRVIATGEDYHVVDTNGDDTHPEWLKANVRRAE